MRLRLSVLPALFLSFSVFGQIGLKSVDLSTTTISGTLPSTAPYTAASNVRWVLRLRNWAQPSTYKDIFDFNAQIGIKQVPGTDVVELWSGVDATYACAVHLTPLGSDVIVEFIRDRTNNRLACHGWAVDGSASTTLTTITDAPTPFPAVNLSGNISSSAGALVSVDYVRVYFDNAVSTSPPPPLDTVGAALAWEFDASDGSETGGLANLTLSGTPTFQTNPNTPPAVFLASVPTTARKDAAFVAAASAYPIAPGAVGALGFLWSKISGPGSVTFTPPTAATTNVTLDANDTYVLQLRVTDSAAHARNATVEIGVVTADAQGRITLSDPRVEQLVGPLLIDGTGPWGWFPVNFGNFSDAIIADIDARYQPFWLTPDPLGTVSIPDGIGGLNVVGPVGFSAKFCPVIPGPVGVYSDGTADILIVQYPNADYGDAGYGPSTIENCTSSTTIRIRAAYGSYGSTPSCASGECTGLHFTAVNSGDPDKWLWQAQTTTANGLYDVGLALYKKYYSSGRTRYRDKARAWVQRWWTNPMIDRGNGFRFGQQAENQMQHFSAIRWALQSTVLWSIEDNHPDVWIGMSHVCDAVARGFVVFGGNGNAGDNRETGYRMQMQALCALYAIGNTSAHFMQTLTPSAPLRAQAVTQVQTQLARLKTWPAAQTASGVQGRAPYWTCSLGWYGSNSINGLSQGSQVTVTNGNALVVKTGSVNPLFAHVTYNEPYNNFPETVWFHNVSPIVSNSNGDAAVYAYTRREWSLAGGTIGVLTNIVVSGGTATATLASGHGLQSGDSIWVHGSVTSPLNGDVTLTSSGSTTITWITAAPNGTYTDAVIGDNFRLFLDRPYAGTGRSAYWDLGAVSGCGSQPYMVSLFGGLGAYYSYLALAAAGDTSGAADYRQMVVDSARYLADTKYAYGVLYSVGQPQCTPVGQAVPPIALESCSAGSNLAPAASLDAMISMWGMVRGYQLATDPADKAAILLAGDLWMDAFWSKPGYSTHHNYGLYADYEDIAVGSYATVFPRMQVEMARMYGYGGAENWLAARLGTAAALSTSVRGLSPRGSKGVR